MAKDPYRYFRVEARELLDGLSRGVLDLEKGEGGGEIVARLLRLAHTLKGAARVVKQAEIAEHAHAVEDVLAPHRESGAPKLERREIDELLRRLDAIAKLVSALESSVAPATEKVAPAKIEASAPPEAFRHLRVEIEEMDALLEAVFEAQVRLTGVRRELDDLERARDLAAGLAAQLGSLPSLERAQAAAQELEALLTRAQRNVAGGIESAERELEQVGDRAHQLRLLPASTLFAPLERAARDAAQSLQRPIQFEASGGDHRVDANVLFALRDALLHVVRNAVAHGIEAEPERARRGKPAVGQLRLDVTRRGRRIAFTCRDDGRGIDGEAVRRAAIAGGRLHGESAALTPAEAARWVLENRISTSATVTEVSGRGVGLDVLRTTVARLKGELSLTSEPGRGTTIDVEVPISLSSVAVLVVDAGGVTAALPLDAVRTTVRLAGADIARSAEHDSVVVDGKVIPFLPLAGALTRSQPSAGARPWSTVVVQAGASVAAIGVDRLVGTRRVLLRPLPRLAGRAPLVAGASLDSDGDPQWVLEPGELVAAAHAGRGLLAPVAAIAPAPILIVDDSLTTRMLEQSILESAGYEVAAATSAEQALEMARARRFRLFVVDVEMPGMTGFEFVERTRADPALKEIPAILVTSRNAPEDLRRGMQAGASAYIVKAEFDQVRLLEIIAGLVG